MDQEFMKEKPVMPLVISMALPMTFSMLVNALYNIIDSYFVAQISEDAMTALSLVFPLQNLVNAVVIGFAIGINATMAYYLGAQKQQLADKTASLGMLLNMLHGLVLAAICIAVMPAFLVMFTKQAGIIGMGVQYSDIVFLFAVPNAAALCFEKIFQAVGRMKTSMFCMLLGCVTNIVLDLVKKELGFFLQAKVPQVKFLDRTFNCNPRRTVDLWQWILDHDNGITNFHFEIAADLITEEELAIMEQMRPGLIQLEIGVQSTNMETVHEIDRVMDLDLVRNVTAKVKSFGNIHQHLDLIAGLPGEDLDSFHKSFDDVFAMEPEQLQLGFLKVLRGTKIHRMAQQYGIVCHDKAPYEVLSTPWLPYKDLLLLKGVEEMVELYYNSHQYEKTLEEILKNYGSPFAFFEELAEFYDRKGYSKISHSRMARYEILREFISEKDWADPVYDQCMIFDLYARERLKSRPAFAADRSPYKEQLREYEKIYGKQVHIEIFTRDSQPVFVLFDYARRNPLTNDAHVEVLG